MQADGEVGVMPSAHGARRTSCHRDAAAINSLAATLQAPS